MPGWRRSLAPGQLLVIGADPTRGPTSCEENVVPAVGQEKCEHPGAAADVQNLARPELFRHPEVDIEIAAVGSAV